MGAGRPAPNPPLPPPTAGPGGGEEVSSRSPQSAPALLSAGLSRWSSAAMEKLLGALLWLLSCTSGSSYGRKVSRSSMFARGGRLSAYVCVCVPPQKVPGLGLLASAPCPTPTRLRGASDKFPPLSVLFPDVEERGVRGGGRCWDWAGTRPPPPAGSPLRARWRGRVAARCHVNGAAA